MTARSIAASQVRRCADATVPQRLDAIVEDYFGREIEEAKRAGRIGYVARLTVQVTLPHSRRSEPYQERRNGPLTVTMMAPPSIGLPYGALARLVLSWVTTEAVRSKSPHLRLGPTLSAYLNDVGVTPSGGPSGSYTRARNQIIRLFATSITCADTGPGHVALRNTPVATSAELWWNPKRPDEPVLFESSVTLNQLFYEDVVRHPVPVDKAALRALGRSPMAIDFYTWLTYRMSYLRHPTVVPWVALRAQFGADYADPRDFGRKARQALRQVARIYPGLDLQDSRRGLELRPSPTHVPLRRLT